MKTASRPNDLNTIIEKVVDIQRQTDAFKKRDMLVDFFGSNGLNLIDESKHQQPKKRYLP